ncbi:MAG TPA: CotH kinase family protein [Flavobacteriales bacterium]|nr:CotH kinase family protein [Flavobacteriales bacterium]
MNALRKIALSISLIGCAHFIFGQNGNDFFSYPAVHTINLNFELQNYFDSLDYYKLQDNETGIEHYIKADVIIDSDTIPDVGIRFRGNSSYDHPGLKKPIQLDFNEFVSGQDYDGLKKLNLNNSHLDPTHMREKLMLDIFGELNLPAPRVTYSAVYFNGNYVGLYKAMETINKDFLETFFTNDNGNLYKCEPYMSFTYEGEGQDAYYDNCEIRTNETENDWNKLVDFIHTVNFTSIENFAAAIDQKFNIQAYLRAWAANMVFGNIDTYFYLPHNFYLYENPLTNKIDWITWDLSLGFGVGFAIFFKNNYDLAIDYMPDNAITERPLSYYCLKNESTRAAYFSEICSLVKTKFSMNYLSPKIDSIAAIIRPYVEMEPDTNREFTNFDFETNLQYGTVNYELLGVVPGLKSYIELRQENVKKQLCNLKWSCAANDFVEFVDGISVYPNPGTVINVKFHIPAEYTSSQFTLYDMQGKKAYETSIPNNAEGLLTLDLSHLKQGIYVLKSDAGCFPIQHKIVVTGE